MLKPATYNASGYAEGGLDEVPRCDTSYNIEDWLVLSTYGHP